MENSHTCDRFLATKDTVLKVLDQYGVAIIPNVLNEVEITNMKDGIWSYLEHITSEFDIPIDRNIEKTWKSFYQLLPMHAMMIQHWQIGHAQFLWDIRQNPKIVDVFATIWNVKPDELLVSFDGASFHLPPEITNRGYYRGNKWYHTDQRLSDSAFKCIQSWVTAFDVNEGDATLTLLEGSHKYHSELAKQFEKIDITTDWYKLNENELQFYEQNDCNIKDITCPAGSMVLWDSRTIHAGKEVIKGRSTPNFRLVAYLCYIPRTLATPANIRKKKKAFEEQRTTSHWPHRPKLFSKYPRTYGATLPTVVDIDSPKLTPLGYKLAGVV